MIRTGCATTASPVPTSRCWPTRRQPGASQLPAGVVQINRENYMLVTTAKDLRAADVATGESRSGDRELADACRDSAARRRTTQGGRQSQISGYYDPIPTAGLADAAGCTSWPTTSTAADRCVLYRATPKTFTDRANWQGWSAGRGAGTSRRRRCGPDRVGEMSIRQIDGKTVLSYFNASTGNMEVRVADDPTGLGTAPVTTVVVADDVAGPGRGAAAAGDNRLAQPYGGYISPGSTLDEVRVFVSQWNTAAARPVALPRHPVRGEPVQALVRGCFCGFRPQCVRSSSERLLDEARCGLSGSVIRVWPQVRIGVQRHRRGRVAQCTLHRHHVAPRMD